MALIIDGKALIHGLADDTKARLLEVGAPCTLCPSPWHAFHGGTDTTLG